MVALSVGETDRQLEPLLRGSGSLSILRAQAPQAALSGDSPDLVILCQPQVLRCPAAILLARRGGWLPQIVRCSHLVAIADSSDPWILDQLAHRRLPALTCGLSHRDSFTLSSLTCDSAVISMQRPLHSFDGSITEPFELPVALARPVEPFTLLAAAAICCLLGRKNPLAGLTRWQPQFSTASQGRNSQS